MDFFIMVSGKFSLCCHLDFLGLIRLPLRTCKQNGGNPQEGRTWRAQVATARSSLEPPYEFFLWLLARLSN